MNIDRFCVVTGLVLAGLLAGCARTNEHDAAIADSKGRTSALLGEISARTKQDAERHRHAEEMARIESASTVARASAEAAIERDRLAQVTARYNADLVSGGFRFLVGWGAALGSLLLLVKLVLGYLADRGGARLEHETKRMTFDTLCRTLPSMPEAVQLAAVTNVSRNLGAAPQVEGPTS